MKKYHDLILCGNKVSFSEVIGLKSCVEHVVSFLELQMLANSALTAVKQDLGHFVLVLSGQVKTLWQLRQNIHFHIFSAFSVLPH